ncbi:Hypothetical_protein [Hexamita inflata]|uniref:Hypothetical_protein n=1 Tax=Hexamita inflata TaxID=28002 RepID=A0AA86VNQ9_9EUKA|nr:Hypothetical protein HINF_LOCUS59283 [Hexamita inflata]
MQQVITTKIPQQLSQIPRESVGSNSHSLDIARNYTLDFLVIDSLQSIKSNIRRNRKQLKMLCEKFAIVSDVMDINTTNIESLIDNAGAQKQYLQQSNIHLE